MSVNKEKLLVAEVTVGMYVCELDRPWLETPFLMQGFLVDDDEHLTTLASHCDYVYVDCSRSREDAIFPVNRANSPNLPRRSPSHKPPQPVTRKQIERQRKVLDQPAQRQLPRNWGAPGNHPEPRAGFLRTRPSEYCFQPNSKRLRWSL